MHTRSLLLLLHISAIAGWLGADVLQHVVVPRLSRDSPEVATAWARQEVWLHDTYYAVIGVAIVVTGVLLVQESNWSWSAGFVWVGIGAVVGGAVLGGGGLGSLAKRRLKALESGDAIGAAALGRRSRLLGLMVTALPLLALFTMVEKWRT